MGDQDIIALLQSRDEAGMRELLVRFGPLIKYIIAPILPNPQDAEDCLSEITMQVWNQIDRFDPQRGSLKSWLTAITRNHALNFKRNIKNHQNTTELTEDMPSQESLPEEQALRRERQDALIKALHGLPKKDEALFYRKYYYMQSTAQIASELGLSERAVEGKLYRIKKRLRKMLGGDEYA